MTDKPIVVTKCLIEFFTVFTKLAEIAILYSKDLKQQKRATSSGAPGARDYCWFRSPMPNHMS